MNNTLRRRAAGILAVAVGFGVIMIAAPASATPVHSSHATTSASVSLGIAPVSQRPNDWWW